MPKPCKLSLKKGNNKPLYLFGQGVSRDLRWISAPIKHKLNVCAFEQTLALAAFTMKLDCEDTREREMTYEPV
jgi:hypothetical protein